MLGTACSAAPIIPTQGKNMVDPSVVYQEKNVIQLARAIQKDDVNSIKKLIDQGVNVNTQGDHDTSLLIWALFNKSKKSIRTLLENGADPTLHDDEGETILHLAAMANDPEYLSILLEQGVDPNLTNHITGNSALFEAILADRDQQFNALLAADINLNITNRVGKTALHIAASTDNAEQVLQLLNAGADAEKISNLKVTFQRYFFMMNENIMTTEGKAGREKVRVWLKAHHITIEQDHD